MQKALEVTNAQAVLTKIAKWPYDRTIATIKKIAMTTQTQIETETKKLKDILFA